MILDNLLNRARTIRDYLRLPQLAKIERTQDLGDLLVDDPGPELAISATVSWLYRAQDLSASSDGGASRHFSFIDIV